MAFYNEPVRDSAADIIGLGTELMGRHSRIACMVCDYWLYCSRGMGHIMKHEKIISRTTSGYTDVDTSPEDMMGQKKSSH
jgi:hypothetical protein